MWESERKEMYEQAQKAILRQKMARAAAEFAREKLCNPEEHRKRWIEALTF